MARAFGYHSVSFDFISFNQLTNNVLNFFQQSHGLDASHSRRYPFLHVADQLELLAILLQPNTPAITNFSK